MDIQTIKGLDADGWDCIDYNQNIPHESYSNLTELIIYRNHLMSIQQATANNSHLIQIQSSHLFWTLLDMIIELCLKMDQNNVSSIRINPNGLL